MEPTPPKAPLDDDLDGTATISRRALAGIASALVALAVAIAGLGGFTLDDLPGGGPTTTSPEATTTTTTRPTTSTTDSPAGETVRDPAGLDGYGADADMAAAEVDRIGMTHPEWTQSNASVGIRDTNGTHPDGQFRLHCAVSHFLQDDPVVLPDRPGQAHWHMFFGNTGADAASTTESLLSTGDSTCQGRLNNRSAYWMPAMIDDGSSFVMPEDILLYYKSKREAEVERFPDGTQLLARLGPDGSVIPTIRPGRESVTWGCYQHSTGLTIQRSQTIPGADGGSPPCPSGMPIALDLQFPQCMARNDDGTPRTTSANLVDHSHLLEAPAGWGRQNDRCPATHPIRLAQITYKVRWTNPAGDTEDGWRLSCDHSGDTPGGCAHADWFGAWSPVANDAWLDGCFAPVSHNCSQGQNGTARRFAPLAGDLIGTRGLENMTYIGPQLITIPGETP